MWSCGCRSGRGTGHGQARPIGTGHSRVGRCYPVRDHGSRWQTASTCAFSENSTVPNGFAARLIRAQLHSYPEIGVDVYSQLA
ncbi:unnamed protein product [Echinostoma caproni]|uniref:Uncharacterized protein n=1 Tax=Echinostoma caproni TaxID=27848 RepID=A0A3P8GY91_9TREM|nr:unnamed protein product [Echinostoma caproni]